MFGREIGGPSPKDVGMSKEELARKIDARQASTPEENKAWKAKLPPEIKKKWDIKDKEGKESEESAPVV